jgi:hypothetical protein
MLVFGALRSASAQLEALGALDSSNTCAHDTCTWVPTAAPVTHTRGEFLYTAITDKDETKVNFQLSKAGEILLDTPLKDWSASISVVWAKDNSAFAITWSDGGAIGNFHVRAFKIIGKQLSEEPVTTNAWLDFKARHFCTARGDNVQAYEWNSSADQLLLVLSVYPTGDCGRDLGHTEAYWVQANTGVIRQRLTLQELNTYIKHHPQL